MGSGASYSGRSRDTQNQCATDGRQRTKSSLPGLTDEPTEMCDRRELDICKGSWEVVAGIQLDQLIFASKFGSTLKIPTIC
jgi:hypothetical protein